MEKDKNIDSAIALKYDFEEDISPKIIAKGQRNIAKTIIEKAKENNIPIYKDEVLLNKLKNLEIDDNIPQELYEAIAQVLFFITNLDNE